MDAAASIRSGIRFDKTGALVEYIGTVVDVTERRRAEHDLRQAREALRNTQTEFAHMTRVMTMGELTASRHS